jgi:hypothetical protein
MGRSVRSAEERGSVARPSDSVDRDVVLGVVDCAQEGFIALGKALLIDISDGLNLAVLVIVDLEALDVLL